MSQAKVPAWVSVGLIPLINILLAFAVSALVILWIGANPFDAAKVLVHGAFGYEEGIGYTLYYSTNFIFTGLAVAMAFHAGLFNIGGEGQAYIGGLGVGIACLAVSPEMSFWLVLPISMIAAAVFGAAWAFIPAYLQAKRGSHIVITTIMFNFIASSLMVYMMVNVLKMDGQMAAVSRIFDENTWLPFMHELLGGFGITIEESPLNVSLLWALVCCVLFYIYIWHTRWGYEQRVVGANATAANYAGINNVKIIIVTMLISGALAGFVGLNEIQGYNHQLKLDFVAGYGFTGIAIALMGRNHPVGIVLASILFGGLYQGGADLSFDFGIERELIVVIQGLVILFSGALENMFKPSIERFFISRKAEA